MTDTQNSAPRIRPENIKILCVDSDESDLKELERIFKFRAFNITLLKTSQEAIESIRQKAFDIILADLNLTDMSGLDLLGHFKEESPDTIRILTTPTSENIEISKAINQGGIYRLITKPWNEDDLMNFVTSAVELTITRKKDLLILEDAKKDNAKLTVLVDSLEAKVQENSVLLTAANRKIQSSYVNVIKAFLNFIEIKNFNLHVHSKRVGHYAMRTAQIAGLDEDQVQNILIAGLLHDVGKLGLSDKVLMTKSISLSDADLMAYQRHPKMSFDSLQILEELNDVLNMIYSHHEHLDGSGFPRGLKANEISQGSRILAIVEAYEEFKYGILDYNSGHEHALNMLKRHSGMYFCPKMLDCFMKIFT